MKRLVVFIFCLTIGLQLQGCAKDAHEQIEPIDTALEDTEAHEEAITEEELKQAQSLIFRDVFGQEYEMEINLDIEPNTYKDSAFVHDGYKLSYVDGDYLLGIDVSHHQGNIDWNRVKAAGYDFAILRIGYRGYGKTGSLNADKMFAANYKQAKEAGLQIGVYFFAQAINEEEAKEEADFVLDLLDSRELDLPVVYDPESILDDESRTDDITGEQFTKNTKVFCQAISDAGYEPMIYTNMLWEAFELDLSQLKEYPIWYADYEEVPQTPYDFDIWQYSEKGQVDGVAGIVDLDILILD